MKGYNNKFLQLQLLRTSVYILVHNFNKLHHDKVVLSLLLISLLRSQTIHLLVFHHVVSARRLSHHPGAVQCEA